jgi:hypothetical protein
LWLKYFSFAGIFVKVFDGHASYIFFWIVGSIDLYIYNKLVWYFSLIILEEK